MPASFYCLDNDIIFKLATCDLFESTLKTLDVEAKQVKILDSLRYKISKQIKRKRGKKSRDQVDKYNLEKTLKITDNLAKLSEETFNNSSSIIKKLYNQLLKYNQGSDAQNNTIDEGEAVLISYVSYLNQQGGSHYLLTGDKRCLIALNNSGLTDVIDSLEGKVWCLEQLILKNIEEIGFENVKNKIVPSNNCDQVLKVAFSHKVSNRRK